MQLFVDQLTNVDFSFLDARRGIVGETWWASALLNGALDEEGMICDFGIVKKTLRNWLDSEADHRLLVPTLSPALTLKVDNERVELTWQLDNGEHIHMEAPRQAVALVDADVINDRTVAAWCREQLREHFPVNVEQLELSFEPEDINAAFYHYSHGLKKHNGNCQRIAHGHRSRLQIWLNNERASALESEWAQRFEDIYLGTEEDLLGQDNGQLQFAYDARQGHFRLSMPASRCYMMDTDTTVELIAEHLAAQIKAVNPQAAVKVKAFEGVNKGAIAIR